MKVAVVGLGAIGGSVALGLLERGVTATAFAASDADRQLAANAGLQIADSIAGTVRDAEVVLIAVPLDALAAVAASISEAAPAATWIFHATSLQRPQATRLDPRLTDRVIGTHPFAGTHSSGFGAASPAMLRGARVFVETRTSAACRAAAEWLWTTACDAHLVYRSAEDHDALMGRASHVPQLVATALAHALARADVDPALLGGGARDTTRLAASSGTMWGPLLMATPASTIETLHDVEAALGRLREALERHDGAGVETVWDPARRWRQRADASREP